MQKEILGKIKGLIGENLILEALENLSNCSSIMSLEKEVVMLKSQFVEVESSLRLNLLSQNEIDIRRNRIKSSILDLTLKYYGTENTAQNSKTPSATAASKIKQGLKMKRRCEKDFVYKDGFNKYGSRMMYEPELKFIFHEVIIRDVADETYPDVLPTQNRFSPHFRSYIHDYYHNGIEFWLSWGSGTKLIVDKEGNWQHLYDTEILISKDLDLKIIKCEMYGRLPFYNVVEYNLDGDMYDDAPHIYCHFNLKDNSPFESYIFRKVANPKEKLMPFEFDPSKMKNFIE